MLGFLSNRATAAHLALAAVAPLVLCRYVPGQDLGPVLLWITLVIVIWAFMSPVKAADERSYESRHRFVSLTLSDPFFWVSLVMLGYAAVSALNSGAGLSYDAELKVWKLVPPALAALPGGVAGSGMAYFAVAMLTVAVYAAAAHALDSRQIVYFAIVAVIAVVLEAVFAYTSGVGISADSSVAYGLWALVAAAAMFSAESSRQRPKELISALALAGCLAALLFTFSPVVICVFVAALLLLTLLFVAFRFRELGFAGVVRTLLMLFVALAIASVLFHWRCGDWQTLIPVWNSDADPVLNRFAILAWEAHPWTGSGVGTFPLVTKIGATAEDWAVMGPMPSFDGNGWRVMMVERGMIGLLAVAVSFGAMLFSWFRYAHQRGLEKFAAAVPLLPIAVAAVSATMVFDGSALQPGAILAFVALAGFSVNGGQ